MQLRDRHAGAAISLAGGLVATPGWIRLRQRGGRACAVAAELAVASFRDFRAARSQERQRLLRCEHGAAPRRSGQRLAIYAHYAPNQRVHPMVLRQIADYAELGFDVVFVTMSPALCADDWQLVRRLCVLLIERRSFGRDFGAWKDAWASLERLYPQAEELLLTNDSMLGPIRPIEPVLHAMRRLGPGLVGLTESRQGPPHLQSYFVLALGRRAVADIGAFLARLALSSSRWLMVRRGEYGLTSFMRARGHSVQSLVSDDEIGRLVPPTVAMPPINPTHHGWRELVNRFDFPFIKTDLIVRNPNHIADAEDWPSVLRPGVGIDAGLIADYLAQRRNGSGDG